MATRYPKALKWSRWFTLFTWARPCGKIPKCSIPIVSSIRTKAKWLNLNISFRSASDGGSVLATSLPKLSFFYSFQRFCTRSNWRCHPVPPCRTWGDRPESPFHRNLSRYVEGIWKHSSLKREKNKTKKLQIVKYFFLFFLFFKDLRWRSRHPESGRFDSRINRASSQLSRAVKFQKNVLVF